MNEDKKIVLLIDAENVSAHHANQIIKNAASHGDLVVRRAYGNGDTFTNNWQNDVLFKFSIRPVLCPAQTSGKNSTDTALIIEAMDLMYRGKEYYDGFCIVSNDSDFVGLAVRLRQDGLKVYGMGSARAATSFVAACDEFMRLDARQEETPQEKIVQQDSEPISQEDLPSDAELNDLLREAVETVSGDDGWAFLAQVGVWLRRVNPGFSPVLYGHPRLLPLVEATDMFEFKNLGTVEVMIRTKSLPVGDA